MIAEGIKLMIIGMSVVLMFLTLMIWLINVTASITKNEAKKELAAMEQERQERANKAKKGKPNQGPPIAVITAAVQAYEQSK